MAVRVFDGVDDKITLAAGACAFDQAAGACTMAALVKRTTDTGSDTIIGAGTDFTFMLAATDIIQLRSGAGDLCDGALTYTAANGWIIIVWAKAAGTVTPNEHRWVLSTLTWTHGAFTGTTVGDAVVADIRFGGDGTGGGPWDGKMAVLGIWNVKLSDAQCVELAANKRTSDWWNNSAGRPKGLWELNQAATTTPVPDLTGGGANETALVGTTVDTGDDPAGWTFDGLGAAAPGSPRRMPLGV